MPNSGQRFKLNYKWSLICLCSNVGVYAILQSLIKWMSLSEEMENRKARNRLRVSKNL